MAFEIPSVDDFKQFFNRDFPFGEDLANNVVDGDITKAMQMAAINFNGDLFGTQTAYSTGFLLLAAHYLVMNLRASSQGINGQFNFLQQGKGAGGVNESFAIPQRILDNPDWAILAKTNYGAQFLQLVLPQLCGQVFTVCGGTQP